MNKSLLTLSLVAGLISESYSASWIRKFFYRQPTAAEATLKSTMPFKMAPDFAQRTLGVRAQKEFKDTAPMLIDESGRLTKDAIWLEDSEKQDVILGHPISKWAATSDHLQVKGIKLSKKIGVPLFLAGCLGGLGGAYASCRFGGSDAVAILGLIATGCITVPTLGAATFLVGVGSNPYSHKFLNNMDQLVLLKNKGQYYYGNRRLSAALRTQGAYKIADEGEPEAQYALATTRS